MALINDFPLLIDLDTGRLVRDFVSNVGPTLPAIRQGDTLRLLISTLRRNSDTSASAGRPWEYVTPPANLRVGVGVVGATPELGFFKLTFAAEETTNLAYNASANDVSTALNALASITLVGGVTVTGEAGGPWQVLFTDDGDQSDITGDGDGLYPATLVTTSTRRNGTASLREIQSITLERQPAAYTDTFTDFPAAAVSVTTLQEGTTDVPEVQRVTLSPIPYGGTFTLTRASKTSVAIPYNATAEELKAALGTISGITPDDPETEDTDESDVQVTGTFPSWDVTFGGTLTGNQSALSGSATGLLVPTGKIGELDLNTEIIGHILGSESELSVTLEIESADEPYTILRETVTLQNDLIPNNPNAPGQTDAFYTKTQSDARFTHQSVVPDTLPSAGQILVGNAGNTAYEKKDGHMVISAAINAASSKTTPVDADEIGLVDSAASNVLKKLTWANLKATLKTYFDTLYGSLKATLSDGEYSGVTESGTAGTTLAFGDLCYYSASDSRWELADADAASTSGAVMLGFCVLAAAADGDPTRILIHGKIRADAAFPTFTVGAPIYASGTAGDVTQTAPTATDSVTRVVGFAQDGNSMWVNISPMYFTHA